MTCSKDARSIWEGAGGKGEGFGVHARLLSKNKTCCLVGLATLLPHFQLNIQRKKQQKKKKA